MYDGLGDRQQRYQDFLAHVPPEQLQHEAALLRVLAESAAQENRPGTVNSLVSTLTRIAATHQAAQIKAGVLMERNTVLQLAKGLVDLVCDTLRKWNVPDYEAITEDIIAGLPGLFERIENEQRPLYLPAPHDGK